MKKSLGLWKKGDFIILGIASLLCIVSFFCLFLPSFSPRRITVTVKGEVYGQYPLEKDQTIEIRQQSGAYNFIEIKDGGVRMIEATCPDHTCIRQGTLHHGGAIICLPNQVVILAETENPEAPDAVVQ